MEIGVWYSPRVSAVPGILLSLCESLEGAVAPLCLDLPVHDPCLLNQRSHQRDPILVTLGNRNWKV